LVPISTFHGSREKHRTEGIKPYWNIGGGIWSEEDGRKMAGGVLAALYYGCSGSTYSLHWKRFVIGVNIEAVSVPVATSAPGGSTNAYVVSGQETFLVDPAAETKPLTRALRDRDVDHILVTHTHSDHVGGVSHYARQSDACVWAHESFVDRFIDTTGVEPDATFREGSCIGECTVLHTPGHAPDHVVFGFGDVGMVGDVAFNDGSVFVGGSDGDMRAYLTSLRRLLTRDFTRMNPGHGSVIFEPKRTITQLIHHRLMRETKVCEAVYSGAETIEKIVKKAYEKDVSKLQTLAELTVKAHLEKLQVEEKVTWDGVTAHPVKHDMTMDD
jgi:glyoxylase-like metal-dependent hydrolase (beta-lactamase superfamily II)